MGFRCLSLELRQYKNGLVSVKIMFVLKWPPFFPHAHGKGKRAASSKLTFFSQKRIRSYIFLALAFYIIRSTLIFHSSKPSKRRNDVCLSSSLTTQQILRSIVHPIQIILVLYNKRNSKTHEKLTKD